MPNTTKRHTQPITMLKVYFKIIRYECAYWIDRVRFLSLIKFIIYLMCMVVVGFNDTKTFFQTELGGLLPQWRAIQNGSNIIAFSVFSIILLSVIQWVQDRAEAKELLSVIAAHIVPSVNAQLQEFKTRTSATHKIQAKEFRACLFLPVRLHFLKWRFQMVCKTDNIPDMEQRAQFELDEGAIGYAFLKTGRHNMDYVELVTPGNNAPKVYRDLEKDNHSVISKDLNAILVAVAANRHIVGLLAIDTNTPSGAQKLQTTTLHDAALSWLVEKEREINLLWRMKNNV